LKVETSVVKKLWGT